MIHTPTSRVVAELEDWLAVDRRPLLNKAIDTINLESCVSDDLYTVLHEVMLLADKPLAQNTDLLRRCYEACASFEMLRTYIAE